MKLRYKILIIVVMVALAYTSGRYLTPTKVQTVTKIQTVVKTITKHDVHTKTITVVTQKPDGTKIIQTTTSQDDDTTTGTATSVKNDSSKLVENDGKDLTNISAMAGVDFRTKNLIYGAQVSKQLLGPVSMGLWGMTDGVVGVSVGISF